MLSAKNCAEFFKKLRDVELAHYASSLSFHTILALIPILLITFSIFTKMPLFEVYYEKPFARALSTWMGSILPAHALRGENLLTTNPDYTNPKMFKAPHSMRQWFRVASWALIALSAIAFLVVMWLPSHPMWLIATVSIVFAVGVLSLFFTAGNPKHNPNLDQNGTAV